MHYRQHTIMHVLYSEHYNFAANIITFFFFFFLLMYMSMLVM